MRGRRILLATKTREEEGKEKRKKENGQVQACVEPLREHLVILVRDAADGYMIPNFPEY